jgi:hypothetical protein
MAMNPRLLRPTPTGFNPRRLANLAVWLDASDASTVTTVSNAVSQMLDKSGNGFHATQTIANNRPSYQLAARNGLNVARFDGSNDFLSLSTTFTQSPFTVIVASVTTTNKFNGLVCERNGNSAGYFGCTIAGVTVAISRLGQAGTNSSLTVTLNSPAILSWDSPGISSSSVTAGIRRNGQADTQTRTISSLQTNPNAVSIGAGGEGNIDQYAGDIGEVVIYSRQLSLLEIRRVEAYLAAKWGATLV